MLQEACCSSLVLEAPLWEGWKKSSGSSVQTVRNEPATYLEPYLKDTAAKAQEAYQQFIAKGYNNPSRGRQDGRD